MNSIISTKTILESSRFKVESIHYTIDSSKLYQKDIIRHPGAVVILPIDSDGNILFVSQHRLALEREFMELPAGTVNEGETSLKCAQRELAEEVGMAAADWLELGSIFPAPGFCDERQFLFIARGLSEFRLPPDPEERIVVQRCSKEQVLRMVADGILQDAKSLALLFKAKVAGLW